MNLNSEFVKLRTSTLTNKNKLGSDLYYNKELETTAHALFAKFTVASKLLRKLIANPGYESVPLPQQI